MNRYHRYQPRRLPRRSFEACEMERVGAHAPDEPTEAEQFWQALDRLARLDLERDGREEEP